MTARKTNTQNKQTSAESSVPSAMRRRLRYGTNVAVAVAAALAIYLLINWLVYHQYRGLSPEARAWVRYDLTSTRRYSLSDQTRSVLNATTEPHQIITMLGGPDADPQQNQQVRDLIGEYARASQLVDAEHLDLAQNSDRRSDLMAQLATLYSHDTQAIRKALADSGVQADQLAREIRQLQILLQQVVDARVVSEQDNAHLAQLLFDLNSDYLLALEQYDNYVVHREQQLGPRWKKRLLDDHLARQGEDDGEELPDYSQLVASLQLFYIDFADKVIVTTDKNIPTLIDRIQPGRLAPPDERERILDAKNKLAIISQSIFPVGHVAVPMAERLQAGYHRLSLSTDPDGTRRRVEQPHAYIDARRVIADEPSVLIMNDTRARVVPASRLFRGLGGSEFDNDNALAQEQFMGEEQLTGALISLTLDPAPLVVFVRSNTSHTAIDQGTGDEHVLGDYNHAAVRLRSMGFEVVDWIYSSETLHQPRPKNGQKIIWVTMPYAPPTPSIPQTMDLTHKAAVFEFLSQQLALGDSAMIMLGPNPYTDPQRTKPSPPNQPGASASLNDDPQVALLRQWGIDAQLYLNAFQIIREDDQGRARDFSASFITRHWPEQAIVGPSLDGIVTHFKQAHPLEFIETDGVSTSPLVVLEMPSMYVQKTLPRQDQPGAPIQLDAQNARDQIILGASAQRGPSRLIAIGDPWWAMDEQTTYGTLPDGRSGPGVGLASGAFVNYPGNSELFLSSIYWLSDHEDLIAASPRTQDLRRIPAMDQGVHRVYRSVLLLGMPIVIFVLGIAVWLVRRQA